MNEWRRPVGADKLDAAIEAQITEDRRKNAEIEQEQRVGVVEHHRLAGTNLERQGGQQEHRPGRHADSEKRQRMDRRPQPENRDVKGIDQKRNDKPEVTLVERGGEQDLEAALADDHNNAGERDADAS